jgi:hypothetical protein
VLAEDRDQVAILETNALQFLHRHTLGAKSSDTINTPKAVNTADASPPGNSSSSSKLTSIVSGANGSGRQDKKPKSGVHMSKAKLMNQRTISQLWLL